jgi:hypothetical protein
MAQVELPQQKMVPVGYLIMTHEILGYVQKQPTGTFFTANPQKHQATCLQQPSHPLVALVSVHSWYQRFRSFSHLSIPGKAFNTIEIPFRKS